MLVGRLWRKSFLPASGCGQQYLVSLGGDSINSNLCLQSPCPSLCTSPSLLISLSLSPYNNASYWIWGPHNPARSHLNLTASAKTLFIIRSHSLVSEVRTSTDLLGKCNSNHDIIQPMSGCVKLNFRCLSKKNL